jgi:hypothetical protein
MDYLLLLGAAGFVPAVLLLLYFLYRPGRRNEPLRLAPAIGPADPSRPVAPAESLPQSLPLAERINPPEAETRPKRPERHIRDLKGSRGAFRFFLLIGIGCALVGAVRWNVLADTYAAVIEAEIECLLGVVIAVLAAGALMLVNVAEAWIRDGG